MKLWKDRAKGMESDDEFATKGASISSIQEDKGVSHPSSLGKRMIAFL